MIIEIVTDSWESLQFWQYSTTAKFYFWQECNFVSWKQISLMVHGWLCFTSSQSWKILPSFLMLAMPFLLFCLFCLFISTMSKKYRMTSKSMVSDTLEKSPSSGISSNELVHKLARTFQIIFSSHLIGRIVKHCQNDVSLLANYLMNLMTKKLYLWLTLVFITDNDTYSWLPWQVQPHGQVLSNFLFNYGICIWVFNHLFKGNYSPWYWKLPNWSR